MTRRPPQSLTDYLLIGINPALIMLLVGSLVFFLLEAFYQGQYDTRLQIIFALFVMAIVCIARISIEEGSGHAMLFAIPLALVTAMAMSKFVDYAGSLSSFKTMLNWTLMGGIWWAAHQLTWDCTVIDEAADASDRGLFQQLGFGRRKSAEATPSDSGIEAPEGLTSHDEPEARQDATIWERLRQRLLKKHAPGVWVVYFSLAALPIFGLGQGFIGNSDRNAVATSHRLLAVYVGSGLALLVSTSFLNLRRYLRKRRVEVPAALTFNWLAMGGVLIVGVVLLSWILPGPGLVRWANPLAMSRNLTPSKWGLGNDGAESKQGRPTPRGQGQGTQQGPNPGGQQPGQQSQGGQQAQSNQPSQSGGQQSGGQPQGSSPSSGQGQGNPPPQGSKSSDPQSSDSSSNTSGKKSAGNQAEQNREPGQQGSTGSQGDQRNGQQQGGGQSGDRGKGNDPSQPNQGQPSPPNQPPQGAQQPQGSQQPNDPQRRPPGSPDNSRTPPQTAQHGSSSNSQQGGGGSGNEPPPPSAPSETNSQGFGGSGSSAMSGVMDAVSSGLGLLVRIAFILGVLFAIWWFRRAIWEALREFWQGLLDWWYGLFGKTRPGAAVAAPVEPTAPVRIPPRWNEFQNPFAAGAARRMESGELIRYTFAALDAWAREHGQPRGRQETPLEFARRLAQVDPSFGAEVQAVAEFYGQLAFARDALPTEAFAAAQRLWQRLGASAPVAATALQ